jgi:arabinofuranan 3-O-arabinosyltransferase
VAQVVALLLCGQALLQASLTASGLDNLLVVQAVRHLTAGESPYVEKRMLYPPSSIPFALPELPFSDSLIRYASPWVVGVLLLGGWWAVLRMFDTSLRSWLGILGIGGVPAFIPAGHLAQEGNWAGAIACLLGVALLLMARDRWIWAGAVIGLSIAVKPMLVPIGLIFLLARQWRGFALAAGLPAAMCAVVLLLLPHPGLFFTSTLPFLLHGQDSYSKPYDSSLAAMLPRLGIESGAFITVARAAVLVLMITVTVLRWRRGGDERLRLVDTSAVLMLGTFLVMSPSFDFYAMVVVPPLLASIVVRGSVARRVWFWISMLPFARFLAWYGIDFENANQWAHRYAFKTLAWIVILLTLLTATAWRRTVRPEQDVPQPDEAENERRAPVPG